MCLSEFACQAERCIQNDVDVVILSTMFLLVVCYLSLRVIRTRGDVNLVLSAPIYATPESMKEKLEI